MVNRQAGRPQAPTRERAPDRDRIERARAAAAAVSDPEIPVLNLADLGILREVVESDGRVVVTLTPTYTGCPATEAIREDVRDALARAGFADAQVRIALAPAWTTDWISEDGRRKLRDYGIAPPAHAAGAPGAAVVRFHERPASASAGRAAAAPECPRCGATRVEAISEHGSTPCKALYRCLACSEPFDYFKPY